MTPAKPVHFITSAREDLRGFPDPVKYTMGAAIREAQLGGKSEAAKPLKGYGGAGVLEVVEDHEGSTYRVVYTVRMPRAVYVLHASQEKSTLGIRTPRRHLELVEQRLRRAQEHYAENYQGSVEGPPGPG
ncbi:MAG TPA: type II toxin-antitoxin system RelE/ParE family toxin [Armatimonadota bacterium]|jgi:phage-related protein